MTLKQTSCHAFNPFPLTDCALLELKIEIGMQWLPPWGVTRLEDINNIPDQNRSNT